MILVVCFVFSGCAAVGKMVQPNVWLGLFDLAVAGGIALFILKGKNEA